MPADLIYGESETPKVSVVVPTFDGTRNGNVEALVNDLRDQSVKSLEIILAIGESPNGHARNVGARIARGEHLVFIDDDVRLGDSDLLARLTIPLEECQDVGLTGVSQSIPPAANQFQKWTARQIPRGTSPLVQKLTDSDMVTTMCLAIPRDLFEHVGMMNERLLAGVDPDLRNRVRLAGYRVVVVPNAHAFHPLPDDLCSLLRYGFKKGGLTAWQYRFARDLMYDCPDGHTTPVARTTLPFRMARKVLRMLREFARLRFLGLAYDGAYTVGYIYGSVKRWR